MVIVPSLYFFLTWAHPSGAASWMQTAVATSLAVTVVTTATAAWAHQGRGAIQGPYLKVMVPLLLAGSLMGAHTASQIDPGLLRAIFGTAALALSIYFGLPRASPPRLSRSPNILLAMLSMLVGFLSSLLGLGGGVFIMPLLLAYGVPISHAVATSTLSTLATALTGSIAFLILTWPQTDWPYFLGAVDVLGFFLIALGAIMPARWGASLAHSLPTSLIRRIFAVALGLTGAGMIFVGY